LEGGRLGAAPALATRPRADSYQVGPLPVLCLEPAAGPMTPGRAKPGSRARRAAHRPSPPLPPRLLRVIHQSPHSSCPHLNTHPQSPPPPARPPTPPHLELCKVLPRLLLPPQRRLQARRHREEAVRQDGVERPRVRAAAAVGAGELVAGGAARGGGAAAGPRRWGPGQGQAQADPPSSAAAARASCTRGRPATSKGLREARATPTHP
jgi:hypothetical protein